jgi:hypothetical protein
VGCDIHSVVEIFDAYDGWTRLERAVFKHPFYNENRPIDQWNTPYTSQPFQIRDYDLFALLADVRNYDGIVPICEPRGVPEDASAYWKDYADDGDIHSVTWFTLPELLAANWIQTIQRSGVVTGATYEAWRDHGTEPESWSASVGGGGVRVVTPAEYDAGERAASPDQPGMFGARTYVVLSWASTLEIGTWERERVFETLIRLAPLQPDAAGNYQTKPDGLLIDNHPRKLDQVRVMVGFDN